MNEEDNEIINGPYAKGGGASSNQYIFNLLDVKNERVILYLCITLIAIFYIVYN